MPPRTRSKCVETWSRHVTIDVDGCWSFTHGSFWQFLAVSGFDLIIQLISINKGKQQNNHPKVTEKGHFFGADMSASGDHCLRLAGCNCQGALRQVTVPNCRRTHSTRFTTHFSEGRSEDHEDSNLSIHHRSEMI